MGVLSTIGKITAGAGMGVGLVTALPIFGAAGAITATGLAVGSLFGAGAALVEDLLEDDEKSNKKA